MSLPEYSVLFSNEGSIAVDVRFEDDECTIAPRKMHPNELSALISNDQMGFHTCMTFDEHPFAIRKYEIDPKKNRLTLFVRKMV